MIGSTNWVGKEHYRDVPEQCLLEVDKVVLLLTQGCCAESAILVQLGFILPQKELYVLESEVFAKIRDAYTLVNVTEQEHTRHAVRFLHDFSKEVIDSQRRLTLTALDHWCAWRDTSHPLAKAREVAEMVIEFGEDMPVKWFDGVFEK